jgi:hypothetical protein
MAAWLHTAGASVQGHGRRLGQWWRHHKQVCIRAARLEWTAREVVEVEVGGRGVCRLGVGTGK